jgi:polar amino acid transport system substrate-binding protein
LRVGVSTNAAPLIYKQGQEIVGLEAEMAKEFANYQGKSLHFIELDWGDQIPALLSNRTDIIMSGMSITKMREVRVSFSTPYFRTGQMALIHRKDKNRFPQSYYGILAQAIILKIGVVKGTTGENFVRKNFGSAKKILSFKTSKIAVDALLGGKIDMLIHDGPIVLMLAAENESAGLMVLSSLMSEEYLAWGIRKNDVTLLDSANSFIDSLQKDGRLDKIVKRWIPYTQ